MNLLQIMLLLAPAAIAAGVVHGLALIAASEHFEKKTSRRRDTLHGERATIIAHALGFLTGFMVIVGPHAIWAADRWMRLIHVTMTLALAALVLTWTSRPTARAFIVGLAAALAALMLEPIPGLASGRLWQLVFATVLAIGGWLALRQKKAANLPAELATWVTLSTSLAILGMLSAFATLALLAASLTGAQLVSLASSLLRRSTRSVRASSWLAFGMHESIILVAWMYDQRDLPAASFVLLAAAPCFVVAFDTARSRWLAAACGAAAVAVAWASVRAEGSAL